MGFHVVKIESERTDVLKRDLLKNSEAHEVGTKSRYEAFRLSFRGESIIAYSSGKVVASGSYTGALLQNSVRKIYTDTADSLITIGSDEAGKGEWLGPLVIAAVALNSSQSAMLRSLGVMDSKELKVEGIADLAHDVKRNCLSVREVTLSPKAFNQRLDELKDEGKNLNDLLAWGHAKAVSECYKATKNDKVRVVIDEFSKLKTKLRLERVLDTKCIDLIQKPRAEEIVAVAAASIVARNARETWIDRQSREFGVDLRKLSSSSAAKRADRFQFAKVSYLKGQSD